MEILAPILEALDLALILLAALILLVFVWLGWLGPRAFDSQEPRSINLTIADVFVGMTLMISSAHLIGIVLDELRLMEDDGGMTGVPTLHYAIRQLFGQLAQLPVIVYVLVRVTRQGDGLRSFGILSSQPNGLMARGILGLVFTIPLILGIGTLIAAISELWTGERPQIAHQMLEQVVQSHSLEAIFLMVISAGIIAPLIEEVIYRGLLQSALLNLGAVHRRWSVIVVAASWFTLMHYGAVEWQGMPSLFIMGVILGWLYERTGSLWPSIVLHMGFNLFNMALVILVLRDVN